MRRAWLLTLAVLIALLPQTLLAGTAHAAAVTIANGTQFTDTAGAVVRDRPEEVGIPPPRPDPGHRSGTGRRQHRAPNQQKYATASSVTGAWSALQDIGDSTAYGSQTAYVLPVQGTSGTECLYMGDRWGNSFGQNVNASTYVRLPLEFPIEATVTMGWFPQLSIATATATGNVDGVGVGVGGPWESLAARHSGKCLDVSSASTADGAKLIQWTCGTGTNQQFKRGT